MALDFSIISSAYAEAPAGIADAAGGGLSFTVILLAFFVFMYFTMIRPQNKRMKEQQQLLSSLQKGDEVVTSGGIVGKINRLADPYLSLQISEGTEILLQKSCIVSVLPKGTLKSI